MGWKAMCGEALQEGLDVAGTDGPGIGEPEAGELEVDEVTGASPGTAQACSDLGLNSLSENLKKFGIKPPGVA